jgi:2-oxoisovalerate ferredoxin oxidoreductase beta subunit
MENLSIKYKKADSFYSTFERKGKGAIATHYCPGCSHGVIQKLIATAIDELKIKDQTIFLSPVGCSVFSYYYFDTGNIECSHGRAPAVATAVKRSLEDSVVISYQGDGDLAGIGMTEIVHAANRGEMITIFFINNATYGMTGGQMAPTTLLGEKTLTTPLGREASRDGYPIKMAELINSLTAPVFISRNSVGNSSAIMQTKKAITKALKNQIDKKGFSFVEILASCPTNLKTDAVSALGYVNESLTKVFPLGVLRDVDNCLKVPKIDFMDNEQLKNLLMKGNKIEQKGNKRGKKRTQKVIIGGFGGQGVLFAGQLLANCAMKEGYEVSFLPSYGPEMRGGSAHVGITFSNEQIGSPLIEKCDVLLAMSLPALETLQDKVVDGGLIIVNSSLIEKEIVVPNVEVIALDATTLARSLDLNNASNVVMLTAFFYITKSLSLGQLKSTLIESLRKKDLLEKNLALIEKSVETLKGVLKNGEKTTQ